MYLVDKMEALQLTYFECIVREHSTPRQFSNLNIYINMGFIEAALATLALQNQLNYTATALLYNIDHTTLSQRHRVVTRSSTSTSYHYSQNTNKKPS